MENHFKLFMIIYFGSWYKTLNYFFVFCFPNVAGNQIPVSLRDILLVYTMNFRTILSVIVVTALVLGFDMVVQNYLLFHVLAEFFAICILVTLFTITWSAKDFLRSGYLTFIGIGGLFIGILDLMHTLTYNGMDIIPSPIYYANQFWIATRFFESLMILLGFTFIALKKPLNRSLLLAVYGIITTAIILSIMVFEVFPICYIEGLGQTPFKIYSEYVIIAILLTSLFVLTRKGHHFEKEIRQLLFWSIVFAVISEFCFTLYVQNYDFLNKLGHISKIVSFFLIFKANVQSGFTRPMETFFHDLKISEEKVKEYNSELEKQVATKNRFFSIVAHDLRNPFTVLLGYSDYLIENYDQLNDDQKKKAIGHIYDTSDQTYKLLENLLHWSLSQSKKLKYNPAQFELKELLDECHQLVEKQAQLKSIEIRKDYTEVHVIADIDMIRTVLRNLLSNALKFTPKGGTVIIKCERHQGMAKISISDTGMGIPADKIDTLFRVDLNHSTHGTESETGSGLGLIVCNEFLRMHQSALEIRSEVNKGSSFSFELPVV